MHAHILSLERDPQVNLTVTVPSWFGSFQHLMTALMTELWRVPRLAGLSASSVRFLGPHGTRVFSDLDVYAVRDRLEFTVTASS